jgi:hypothetical protein
VGLVYYVKRNLPLHHHDHHGGGNDFLPDSKEAFERASALVKQAGTEGKWTPDQDRDFLANLSDLPMKKRLELSHALIKLINSKKVVRTPESESPYPACEWAPGPHNCVKARGEGAPAGDQPKGDVAPKGAAAPATKKK